MSVDWTKTMKQSFEFYEVDPDSWCDKAKLDNVTGCTIIRDSDAETLGSASFDVTASIGEAYIRPYLVVIQNGITYRYPLGTFLAQTPNTDYDGKIRTVSMDAYTPLLELKEKMPALGYTILKENNIMEYAYKLTEENLRAPVTEPTCDSTLSVDFTANTDDTWLSFLIDLMTYADYSYDLDELGRVLFAPTQETEALQPVWTYTDDNSSILYPEITLDRDLYGIPNVVEVIYSDDTHYISSRVENNDTSSPISIVNRGREILYRDTSPSFSGTPTQEILDWYAEKLLETLSEVEYTVTYTHGYCPVRLGDCVRLNYRNAELSGIKAKVIYQSISCTPGCPVSEKASFTNKLWEA